MKTTHTELNPDFVTPVIKDIKVDNDDGLKPLSYYAQFIRPLLSKELFQPNHSRVLWFIGALIISAVCVKLIISPEINWIYQLALSLVLGNAFGMLGFFSHDLIHGSVVKSRKLQDAIGLFSLAPFIISPTFWRYWHNGLHHGNTQALISDPDAFPTLRIYRHSRFMQAMFPYTPGSGHKRSVLYFFFWFSLHAFVAQFYLRTRNTVYEKLNHKRVKLELSVQIGMWAMYLFFVGWQNWLWCMIIPVAIQNYYVMSYIATNHNLSPLSRINDPLVNSLTVTNHPWLEKLHFNFGYHIEHHIFPSMSSANTKEVHQVLMKHFGNKMKVMKKSEAMKRLYSTARIYKDSKTLINPETGATYPTI